MFLKNIMSAVCEGLGELESVIVTFQVYVHAITTSLLTACVPHTTLDKSKMERKYKEEG